MRSSSAASSGLRVSVILNPRLLSLDPDWPARAAAERNPPGVNDENLPTMPSYGSRVAINASACRVGRKPGLRRRSAAFRRIFGAAERFDQDGQGRRGFPIRGRPLAPGDMAAKGGAAFQRPAARCERMARQLGSLGMMSPAREIVARLRGRWFGTYGTVRCPAHEDKSPSLRIRDGEQGAPLVNCYSG
jgi:hypothetical protein